ncbi:hypothetical protein VTL71DRAFT_1704 [Oculimacula yallundae]|uniref:Uncharacterized protein n=1 Tax=Oculimacula yallundae TaxID=86028 RepID=A0ABR4CBH4_9HELO
MPIRCFVLPDAAHENSALNHLATMRSSVRTVQNFHVQSSGSYLGYVTESDFRMIPQNLAAFLDAMPLRHLSLVLPTVLSSPFYDLTFPHLTTFRLGNIDRKMSVEKTLPRFLSRHWSTLRRLYLNCVLKIGDVEVFLPRESRCFLKQTIFKIKDTLKLEKFELLIRQDDNLRIYDDDWNEISGRESSDAKQLEKFVLGIEGEAWLPSKGHVHQHCPLVTLSGENVANITQVDWDWPDYEEAEVAWDIAG